MSSSEGFFTSFSYEEEIERAEWFKNDLDQGGWKEVHNSPGRVYWEKTFPEGTSLLSALIKITLTQRAQFSAFQTTTTMDGCRRRTLSG